MAGIFDRLRGWLRKKPAPRPKFGRGHRGVAAGDLKNPDLAGYAERLAQGFGEILEDEVEGFLTNEQLIFVNSTNVVAFQYFPNANQMMVEYRNGGAYLYSQVTYDEAQQLINAQSKGGKIWDLFRVRGSRTAHKKPYTRIK